MYAELVAVDRLSFNQVAKSKFIRSAMQKKKLFSHSSPSTIRTKVDQFFRDAKAETKKYVLEEKEWGQRYSLTFDE